MLFNVLACIGVFAITVGYNFVYALYQDASQQRRPWLTANLDTLLYAMSVVSLGALLFVGWWMIAPEAVGNWVGTYLGTRYASKKT